MALADIIGLISGLLVLLSFQVRDPGALRCFSAVASCHFMVFGLVFGATQIAALHAVVLVANARSIKGTGCLNRACWGVWVPS
jgi:hypothetical protein